MHFGISLRYRDGYFDEVFRENNQSLFSSFQIKNHHQQQQKLHAPVCFRINIKSLDSML